MASVCIQCHYLHHLNRFIVLHTYVLSCCLRAYRFGNQHIAAGRQDFKSTKAFKEMLTNIAPITRAQEASVSINASSIDRTGCRATYTLIDVEIAERTFISAASWWSQ